MADSTPLAPAAAARRADFTEVHARRARQSENLVGWLRYPQQVVPGNAMPDLGVSEADARNIAAYLDTLR